MGTVSKVLLEEELIVILCHPDSKVSTDAEVSSSSIDFPFKKVSITVPINDCAQAYHRNKDNLHCNKEVLIISSPNKGWQGSLVSCSLDRCIVTWSGQILETYKKDEVVVQCVHYFVTQVILLTHHLEASLQCLLGGC